MAAQNGIATGGNIWEPERKRKISFTVILYAGVFLLALGTLISAVSFASDLKEKVQDRDTVLIQEYGSLPDLNYENDSATVTKSTGEQVTLRMIRYKDYLILGEDAAELDQKMTSIDEGTYPEELKNLLK